MDETGCCTWRLATALRPGAIAIVQLAGSVDVALRDLTGRDDWPIGCSRLITLSGIDDAVVTRPGASHVQVMPHGGVRVVQRLILRLRELGVADVVDPPEPALLYPEAGDGVEAAMLAVLARAASPLAIDLLLDQPRRHRVHPGPPSEADRARARRLRRLVDPAAVVLAGPPNVGKSTLGNTLLGRALSISADRPGTTRDYTAGLLELAGLVVRWHDTPGLRARGDAIETSAIERARRLIADADLLIAITDAAHDWPDLGRTADLRVASKADLARREDADLHVSATTGEGLGELVRAARNSLVPPEDLAHPGPWLLDER